MVEMRSRPSQSNWLVCVLSINRIGLGLGLGKNFRMIANLAESNDIPNSIEEDAGRSTPAVAEFYIARKSIPQIHWKENQDNGDIR